MSTPTPTGCWYAINAAKGAEFAEIRIYDAIGAFGITADAFVSELAAIKASQIDLRLNTPGGEVFAATAIYNALKAHPARIVVHVDGVAASAGSFIAMSGDEIRMADNAYMMIHNARGGVMGEATDMQRYAAVLEKMNANIAGIYERKTGKPSEHWAGLMNAETWFTAEEAKAESLVDTVYAAEKKAARNTAYACIEFAAYNKIPDPVRDMWGLIPPTPVQIQSVQPAGIPAAVQTNQAPEDSTVCVEPSPALSTEIPPMAEPSTIQAAPAQNPAPAINSIPQGDTVSALNQQALAAASNTGKALGYQEGIQAEQTRMRQIAAACPGRPQIALDAFLAGQNESTVRLINDAAAASDARNREALQAKEVEIARLNAINAAGGYIGGVSMSFTPAQATAQVPSGVEPSAQAELEWNSDANLRAKNGGDAGKKRWLLYRTQQLSGNVAVLAR